MPATYIKKNSTTVEKSETVEMKEKIDIDILNQQIQEHEEILLKLKEEKVNVENALK